MTKKTYTGPTVAKPTELPPPPPAPVGNYDKITFRTGELAKRVAKYCNQHGITPGELGRIALAKFFKVEPPILDGQIKNLRHLQNLSKRALAKELKRLRENRKSTSGK